MTEAICKWIPMIENEWPGEWMEVEPLIRCKDCIRWRHSKSDTAAMVCDWDGYEKTESDYCSWAKRRKDG